jgi:hypothetical protein
VSYGRSPTTDPDQLAQEGAQLAVAVRTDRGCDLVGERRHETARRDQLALALGSQRDEVRPAVAWVGAALGQAARLDLVDHLGDHRRADVEATGERLLGAGSVCGQQHQHAVVPDRDAERAQQLVRPFAAGEMRAGQEVPGAVGERRRH